MTPTRNLPRYAPEFDWTNFFKVRTVYIARSLNNAWNLPKSSPQAFQMAPFAAHPVSFDVFAVFVMDPSAIDPSKASFALLVPCTFERPAHALLVYIHRQAAQRNGVGRREREAFGFFTKGS